MQISDILSAYQTGSTGRASFYTPKQEETSESSFGFSNARDSASISSEAVAAYEAAMAARPTVQEGAAAGQNGTSGSEPEEDDADATLKEFQSYVRKASGEEVDTANSPEERLEKLKKKLEQLQAKKAEVASDESLPDETKNSRLQTLDAQIDGVMAEISELTSELAALAGKE